MPGFISLSKDMEPTSKSSFFPTPFQCNSHLFIWSVLYSPCQGDEILPSSRRWLTVMLFYLHSEIHLSVKQIPWKHKLLLSPWVMNTVFKDYQLYFIYLSVNHPTILLEEYFHVCKRKIRIECIDSMTSKWQDAQYTKLYFFSNISAHEEAYFCFLSFLRKLTACKIKYFILTTKGKGIFFKF